MKYTLFLLSILSILTFSQCKNSKANADHEHGAHDAIYACPMDCEKGKHYHEAGKCPVCGMDLEAISSDEAAAPKLTYKMTFTSTPQALEAGKAATFSFKPTVVGKEAEPLPLDVQHDKKIHLICVSEDLSYFEHIHPEYQADGSYKIDVIPASQKYKIGAGHDETKFADGGNYTLFADYLPSGGTHQVEKINISVAGKPKPTVKLAANKWTATSGEYKVNLTPDTTSIQAGKPIHIAGIITNLKGVEVSAADIENYLGAKAHMVVVSLSDKEYLHVHPDVTGGKFDLNTTFAKAGMYKGWIQFQIKGIVHTCDFTFDVK
jgi:hypothetical protein